MDCKTAQQKIMPYIEHTLSDREMEDFIEHIRGCKACSEELEVYFTIYYALEQLDNENQGTYDIQKLLERDLKQRENSVRKHGIVRFYERLLIGVMAILLCITLATAVQIFVNGSIEKTTLYKLFSNDSETQQASVQNSEQVPVETAEETEQETNHKRQVIVTTPETEVWQTEPERNG